MASVSREPRIYRQPILAFILRVFGAIAAAVAAFALFAVIFGLVTGDGAAGALLALPVLVSALVSALILFGVAQVIDYLGRTAHAAEEAADAAQDSTDLLRQLIRAYGHEPEA